MKSADNIQNDTDWTKFVAESGSSLERTEELRTRFIQQIQADALRHAAVTCRPLSGAPACYRKLVLLADQLDPIPERQERCHLCGNMTSDWVDPDWASGRVCRPCEIAHQPK